jgi:hypothetical protein
MSQRDMARVAATRSLGGPYQFWQAHPASISSAVCRATIAIAICHCKQFDGARILQLVAEACELAALDILSYLFRVPRRRLGTPNLEIQPRVYGPA